MPNTYNINDLEARSTDYNRTKMSLELALAGLYPPKGKQVWSSVIPWQPIPYNYYVTSEDKVGYILKQVVEYFSGKKQYSKRELV